MPYHVCDEFEWHGRLAVITMTTRLDHFGDVAKAARWHDSH